MKIKRHIYYNSVLADRIRLMWNTAADQASLEFGIFVEALELIENGFLTRIYFKIDDHEFDSQNDLMKALNNKAFL